MFETYIEDCHPGFSKLIIKQSQQLGFSNLTLLNKYRIKKTPHSSFLSWRTSYTNYDMHLKKTKNVNVFSPFLSLSLTVFSSSPPFVIILFLPNTFQSFFLNKPLFHSVLIFFFLYFSRSCIPFSSSFPPSTSILPPPHSTLVTFAAFTLTIIRVNLPGDAIKKNKTIADD